MAIINVNSGNIKQFAIVIGGFGMLYERKMQQSIGKIGDSGKKARRRQDCQTLTKLDATRMARS